MQKNILKEIIRKKCNTVNRAKKKRQKKYKPKDELIKLSSYLGVNWWTAWHWYANKSTPKGENFFKLPAYYGLTLDEFYYYAD